MIFIKGSFTLSHISDNSFPSNHVAIGTAFIIALALFGYKKTSYIPAPLFILMFLARIIGGMYYPFDILGGITVDIVGVYLIWKIQNIYFIQKLNQIILFRG